jgi:hypothetical protein
MITFDRAEATRDALGAHRVRGSNGGRRLRREA